MLNPIIKYHLLRKQNVTDRWMDNVSTVYLPPYKLSYCSGVELVGVLFVCVEVLWPSQPNGVMLSAVSLPNHMFTGQA